MAWQYMEDCIHLKACRRMSKLLTSKGVHVNRGCNEECTAYINYDHFDEAVVTVGDALEYGRHVMGALQYGTSPDDMCLYESDVEGQTTIGEILQEELNKDYEE